MILDLVWFKQSSYQNIFFHLKHVSTRFIIIFNRELYNDREALDAFRHFVSKIVSLLNVDDENVKNKNVTKENNISAESEIEDLVSISTTCL